MGALSDQRAASSNKLTMGKLAKRKQCFPGKARCTDLEYRTGNQF